MKKNIYLVLLFFSVSFLFSQNKNHILLLNGVAHLGNGTVIESSAIAFKNGKITLVADAKTIKLDLSAYDTVIRIANKHVYPGLISCNNILGLQEAEAVRPTSDYAETEGINPNLKALIAYNTDSKIIPTIKTNGVLYTQCTPRGGLISGTSSVFATEGWNWEDAVLKADDGVHLNFPRSLNKNGWWGEPEPSNKNNKYEEEIAQLGTFFENAKAYIESELVSEINLRFEALKGVFAGKQNLYLHSNSAKDMIIAINFIKSFGIKNIVLVGGKDSWKITSFLKENQIPVMLTRLHDLPDASEDDIDITFKTPFLLQKDSILFALQMEGDMEAMQSRNLPFIAGTAAAYGLTKEQALSSITLNAAKILGISDLVGSIEINKLASLVISDGDILDMKTNNVSLAFIAGKHVNLYNDQSLLYQKYKSKYGLK